MRKAGVTFVIFLAGAAAAAGAGAGCTRRHAPAPVAAGPETPATPATLAMAAAEEATPQPQGGTLDRPKLGVRLDWPAGWAERRSDDYVLLLVRTTGAGAAAAGEAPSISLDVPDLPPHLPGMIPIGSVRGGYLDDLRKSVGPLKTRDEPAPAVPNAAARLVHSTWTGAKGQAWQETALLLVHADRVYILRARSAAADEEVTRAAFDAVVRSLEWTKKAAAAKRP